jgi:cardiolipin synthase
MFVLEYLDELIEARHTPRAWVRYVRNVWRRSRSHIQTRHDAARSVLSVAVGLFVLLFAAAAALTLFMRPLLGTGLFVAGSTWLILGTVWMLLHIGLLRDESGAPFHRLNLANALTLLRFVLIPGIFVFVVAGERLLAGASFLGSAATDVLDGMVARRMRQVTRMGVVLDPMVDMAHNGVTLFALAVVGLVPGWVFALVALRYGLLIFGSAFIYFKRGRLRVQPTVFGKLTGVLITFMVAALMFLRVFGSPGLQGSLSHLIVIGLGFIFLATIIQVTVIGWHNFRYAHHEERGVVVGQVPWRGGRTRA